MSRQDPVADALTRIRNAQAVNHKDVIIPGSKVLLDIFKVMQEEGFIASYEEFLVDETKPAIKSIKVVLRYFKGKPVIETLKRLSSPGRKQYMKVDDLPMEKNGLGVVIVTTSKGVMTTLAAKKLGVGGELLVAVY